MSRSKLEPNVLVITAAVTVVIVTARAIVDIAITAVIKEATEQRFSRRGCSNLEVHLQLHCY